MISISELFEVPEDINLIVFERDLNKLKELKSKYNTLNKITYLNKVDINFLKSIKDYKEMYFNQNSYNKYHTIIHKDQKVGIVGIILENNLNFFQIAIHQKFRGKGLLNIASDLIAQKYKLKILNSTIEHDNISSIKAHKKAGFKMIPKLRIKMLIKLKKLNDGQIRMVKEY